MIEPGASAGSSDAITANGLTRAFGDFLAVDDVHFRVGEGEIFGFLGPNGAGKTTTIKMLTGLLRPTAGTGSVGGLDLVRDARRIVSRIGYMSQTFSLYGDLTVSENIELFGGLYGVSGQRLSERTRWILSMAGLEGREDAVTAPLPLGWRQRLALGCAVLHEPRVLFLDEPTSGVDPVARRAFWDLIDDMAANGTTVLVSTHYMEEAEYCHRLLLMNRGSVIAEGTPTGLRERMTEPIYEIEAGDAHVTVESLRDAPGIIEATMFGRLVHVVIEDGADPEGRLRAALAQNAIDAIRIRRIEPALEDVFVALVRTGGGAVVG
ncbi:MAG: ATP-binding cassette domain-containing protein [Longimicrobiales bacterium]